MSTLEEKLKKKRTGAEILIDVLNEVGVEYLFAHTGGAVIPIHVELNKRLLKNEKTPKVIMFRQEPGAGHAAEGYARVTGKVGVALATSGPGATNLVTPIADAYKDSIPCVFITGQVPSFAIGDDSFQEVDTIGITRPITKYSYLVKDVEDLAWMLKNAFYIASTGRKGPVVVDVCKDAMLATSINGYKEVSHPGYKPNTKMNVKMADLILEALVSSEKPVILAGGGVISSNAYLELYQFASRYNIPVTLTFMGLGAIPHDSPLFLGMPGMHGTIAANYALKEADFILNIGSRFDDRVLTKDLGKKARMAHIDIEPAEINKSIPVQYPLTVDAKEFLKFVLVHNSTLSHNISPWLETVQQWKNEFPRYRHSDNPIKPQYLIEQLSLLTQGKATVVTGVGQHQMWTTLYYNFQEPRQWISSGGLGTMGFGLPAAIGAYYGNPSRQVICIDGDGSFQMNIQELATIAANKLPIKVFVMNNGYLGMVRQWEDMFSQGFHYETCLNRTIDCCPGCTEVYETCRTLNPDLVKLSEVYPGIKTLRLTLTKDVKPALEQVLNDNKPYVVDVWIDKTENVMPMIPAGGLIENLIREI